MVILSILGICFVLVIIFGWYEIKHAHTVPSDEPFLHDDYDPKKDPTKKG